MNKYLTKWERGTLWALPLGYIAWLWFAPLSVRLWWVDLAWAAVLLNALLAAWLNARERRRKDERTD